MLAFGLALAGPAATQATPSNGSASAFGANAFGELGVAATGPQTCGSITCSKSPVAVGGLPLGAVTISSGARHSLAIMGDTTVKAWGRNSAGEVGDATTLNRSTPVSVVTNAFTKAKLSSIVAVDGNAPPITATSLSGDGHSLALRSDHTVWAWGTNGSGQQGINPALGSLDTCGSSNPCSQIARPVPGLTNVSQIATGASFNLALKADGSVWAWGLDASDQLGVPSVGQTCGASAKPCSWTPVQVTGLGAGSGVVQITAGSSFGMARKADGTVLAWGNNNAGELGNGTQTSSASPVTAFAAGSNVVQIVAGDAFALARKADGSIWSWGNNNSGQLGTGSLVGPANCTVTAAACALSPTAVTGLGAGSTVTTITAGFSHAAALKANGSLLVWGHNNSGQLGNGSSGTDMPTPAALSLAHVTQVSAGGSHTLVLRAVAPAAPTAVAISPGITSAAVRYTPPAFGGGSAITGYTAACTSSNAGIAGTASGATNPLTVTGLTTGKTYTCTVKATNAIGTGPASAPSAPVIIGSPAPPTSVRALSGSTTAATGPARVSFVPGANNGSTTTLYTATCTSPNGGVAQTATASASPISFTGVTALTTAKTYLCTVKGTNARGAGPASMASIPLVEGSPAPPTIGTVTKTSAGVLSVAFTAGANNGSAITGFTAQCLSTNGGVSASKTGASSPLAVTGLTTGRTYQCTVKGINARGAGITSPASVAVIA